jgi:hypothetical protein
MGLCARMHTYQLSRWFCPFNIVLVLLVLDPKGVVYVR